VFFIDSGAQNKTATSGWVGGRGGSGSIDLGCGLTKIVLLSELMTQSQFAPDEVTGHVRQVASTAKQQIKALDETVWAINPRNDTVPDLIDYIAHFAVESLRAVGIECILDLPDDPPDLPVPSENRHHLFLVVKEAINNVMRHSQAREVRMRITVSCDGIAIEISDIGRGFVSAPGGPGQDGLRNMEQRMRDIGGNFALQSGPESGTKVSLNYAWRARGRILSADPR